MTIYDRMEQIQSFSCRIDNVKSITDVLTCLSGDLNKDQPCYIEVTPEAIMLIVTGRGKASQARLSLQAALFDEYNCRSANSIKFVLNLTILIDCLHMFGSASETVAATMSYSSVDAIFKLSLEESGVITDCDISCLYDDDFDELQQGLFVAFRDAPEECQIIIKSEPLKESIQELTDSFWAGSVQVDVNNNPSYMKLSTGGTVGASEVNIPRASDAFVSFRCSNPVTSAYSLKSLLLGMKVAFSVGLRCALIVEQALSVSKETYIRINTKGIMCIQHQIESAKGIEVFFDFLMVSEESVE